MYIHKLAAAAASKPVVTGTATSLLTLMTTAGSAAHGIPGAANAFDICPEDGDVRMMMDGNTPTAANGLLLKQGSMYLFRNIPLSKVLLIRTGGSNVTCSVQVGQSEPTEVSQAGQAAVSVTVTADTEFPAAGALGDGAANPSTTQVGANMSGFNNTTWDRIRAGITAINATFTGWLNVLPRAIFNTTPTTRTNGQGGPLEADAKGNLLTNDVSLRGPGAPVVDSYTNAPINAAANTNDQALVAAPGVNKQIWVMELIATAGTADGTVSFQDSDDTALSGVMEFSRRGGIALKSDNFAAPLFKVATNKALEVDTVTCDLKGIIGYAIVSV